ncbi:class III lanthionine synthetase LanKC [Winogradskya consettensis]|uniref:Serine/threonine protein kinase n=1 Tax=Winogradskya consettensis TaxID=113560 RepID=A0A919SVP2_9ACTN|nr:class III lanthionine synthetase LanKC [Actinoplanes consettensis]GIM79486.1 serine/threonine protein kinase [Actinoplanes consettensis]
MPSTRSYDDYCLPGSVFFERPAPSLPGEGFPELPLPPGEWTVRESADWRMAMPNGADLPEQGWKLHVSATPATAAGTLAIVADYCVRERLPFKHLPSPASLLRRNSKYAGRGGSGKFVTIYPRDFTAAAADLSQLLLGRPGPYILSDRRIGDGPVYARYGGFRSLTVDGVPAIRRPDGVLVPDVRSPAFQLPDWVTLPPILDRPRVRTELPYRVTGALHFSNGGGVYRAERDGRTVVLKEARPHAGLDVAGNDAVHRLKREHEVLCSLAGIPGIPVAYELFEAWEHTFLAMEEIAGIPLGRWIAVHSGLYGPDDTAYRRRATAVAGQLDALVAAVHERGWVIGDLHPRNVLVGADDTVRLIDFECAEPIGSGRVATLGVPGFRAPPGTRGADLDHHALAAIRLTFLVPLTPLLELAPEKLGTHLRYARDLPAATAKRLRDAWQPTRAEPEWPGPDPVAALVRALHATATPERGDRLFPGDIEQFRSGGAGFGHGAAGVLHALAAAGEPLVPAYGEWLRSAEPPAAAGFWTGTHGVAYVLDRLGYEDRADVLLDLHTLPEGPDFAGGLAGAGLTLLDIATRRRTGELIDRAVTIAERMAAQDGDLPAGLLTGWSGPALFCLRLFERTYDDRWLSEAARLLDRDLARCPFELDSGRQYLDGNRRLPYVGTGSAGVALVAAELAPHLPDAAAVQALPELRQACMSRLTAYPGLMQGRAGLLLAAPGQSVQSLELHAVRYADGIAFPGTTLRRLSMDVDGGTAGILLALVKSLPFFTPPTPGHPAGPNRKESEPWKAFSNSRN